MSVKAPGGGDDSKRSATWFALSGLGVEFLAAPRGAGWRRLVVGQPLAYLTLAPADRHCRGIRCRSLHDGSRQQSPDEVKVGRVSEQYGRQSVMPQPAMAIAGSAARGVRGHSARRAPLLGHLDWMPAFYVAIAVSGISAVLSMMLLQIGLLRGPTAIAGSFIISWLVRSAVSLGGCAFAIVVFHVPPGPTLLGMVVCYIAVLIAEVLVMYCALFVDRSRRINCGMFDSLNILAAINPLPHVTDHPQIIVGNWWVLTNHMIMLMVTAVIMLLVFPAMTRRFHKGDLVMTGTNNFFEAILMYMRDEVVKPLLGDETDRFIGFLWTLFFFILINNILGLLPLDIVTRPIVTMIHLPWTIGSHHAPHENHGIFGTATGNFYVTATLALIAFVVIQVNGIRDNGVSGWMKHFLGGRRCSWHRSWSPLKSSAC